MRPHRQPLRSLEVGDHSPYISLQPRLLPTLLRSHLATHGPPTPPPRVGPRLLCHTLYPFAAPVSPGGLQTTSQGPAALGGVFLVIEVQAFQMLLQLVQAPRLDKFRAREGGHRSSKMSASHPPCRSLQKMARPALGGSEASAGVPAGGPRSGGEGKAGREAGAAPRPLRHPSRGRDVCSREAEAERLGPREPQTVEAAAPHGTGVARSPQAECRGPAPLHQLQARAGKVLLLTGTMVRGGGVP